MVRCEYMSRTAAGHLAVTDSLYFRNNNTMDNKLDFLMKLTGSKNNALSKAVSFDPSYVSRIRDGVYRRSLFIAPGIQP